MTDFKEFIKEIEQEAAREGISATEQLDKLRAFWQEKRKEIKMAEIKKPICQMCNDTHIMNDRGWACTHCPIPCQECRGDRTSRAFCENTPCNCFCHSEENKNKNDELMQWYDEPLTKEHIAELRFKLAKCRGAILTVLATQKDSMWYDEQEFFTTEQLETLIKETSD
jgi:hypothetical protein